MNGHFTKDRSRPIFADAWPTFYDTPANVRPWGGEYKRLWSWTLIDYLKVYTRVEITLFGKVTYGVWSFYDCEDVDVGLLGCNAAWTCRYVYCVVVHPLYNPEDQHPQDKMANGRRIVASWTVVIAVWHLWFLMFTNGVLWILLKIIID